jgi:hypothetical protein
MQVGLLYWGLRDTYQVKLWNCRVTVFIGVLRVERFRGGGLQNVDCERHVLEVSGIGVLYLLGLNKDSLNALNKDGLGNFFCTGTFSYCIRLLHIN